jgi:hypothetical protein
VAWRLRQHVTSVFWNRLIAAKEMPALTKLGHEGSQCA